MKPRLAKKKWFSTGEWAWAPEEDIYLHEHARDQTMRRVAKYLRRSIYGVRSRAAKLSITYENPSISFHCDWCKKPCVRQDSSYHPIASFHVCSRRCYNLFRKHRPCPLCRKVDTKRTGGRTCGACRHIYRTVAGHHYTICTSVISAHLPYKGMPFYPAWNPKVGGSFIAGARWIYKNIGTRPTSSWTLDIIKHAKGFVPGNLRWADKKTQKDNQQHRMIGKMTDMEFAVEARRRGWVSAATALGYHETGITTVDVKVLVPAS